MKTVLYNQGPEVVRGFLLHTFGPFFVTVQFQIVLECSDRVTALIHIDMVDALHMLSDSGVSHTNVGSTGFPM